MDIDLMAQIEVFMVCTERLVCTSYVLFAIIATIAKQMYDQGNKTNMRLKALGKERNS